MEELYKLQELESNGIFTNKKLKYFLFALWLVGMIIFTILALIANDKNFIVLTLIIAFSYSTILGIMALTMYFAPKNNKENKYLKEIGKKNTGYIINTGFSCHGRSCYKLYYITILYKEKFINIYKLKDNNAYKILTLLLNSQSYPINKIIKIPIDIYCYKNKIYADFENLKLSDFEGYEEAKKVVESM